MEDGHDVYAIDSAEELEGTKDPVVLELAISEGRVLVTASVSDFMALITELGNTNRSHSGCILIPRSIRSEDFGAIISGIRDVLENTSQKDWIDRVEWIRRG